MWTKRLMLLAVIIITASCSNLDRFFKEPGKHNGIYIGTSDCALPCIFDITIGKTDFSSVANNITSQIPTNQIIEKYERYWNFWIYGTDHNKTYVTIKSIFPFPSNSITSIELSNQGQGRVISLGDMIDAGFKPTKVFRNRVSGPNSVNLLITFGKDEQIIGEVSASNSLNAQSPISDLYLANQQYSELLLDDIRAIRHYDYEIKWLGYASVDIYWANPPIR